MQLLSSLLGQKAVIILAIAFVLIVVAVLFVVLSRTLGDRAGRGFGARSRQQRLGVVDAFDLDRQRQLVIIRRDNVEHLVMIGGPNDLVVESTIIRQAIGSSPPLGQREPQVPAPAAGPAPSSPRQPAAAFEPRPDFAPAPGEAILPTSTRAPAAPAPPPGPRFPVPLRPGPPAAQRLPPREAKRIEPPKTLPPAPPPPEAFTQVDQLTAPPPPAPEEDASAPLADQLQAQGHGPAPLPAAPSKLQPRLNPLQRASRPFPTLRPGGGPLFPIRGAQRSEPEVQPEPQLEPQVAPPPPANLKPNVLDAFESLEEEMAKLLGRPSSGEG